MASGIRATVEFTNPEVCPIVEWSAEGEETIDRVAVSVCAGGCTECVLEFSADAAHRPDDRFESLFSHGSSHRYRLVYDDHTGCPCASLGEFGCAVDRYVAQDGSLMLVFYVSGFEHLRTVVSELRERFPGVDIKRFIRSPAGDPGQDNVFVDRSRLTDRQLEVLQLAYERGYFARPRGANATELAEELGIDASTFSQHLGTAESKLLSDVLADRV